MLNGLRRSFQRHGSPAQDSNRPPWSCDVAPGAATSPLELRRRPSNCEVAAGAATSPLELRGRALTAAMCRQISHPSRRGRAAANRPDIRRALRANRTAARGRGWRSASTSRCRQRAPAAYVNRCHGWRPARSLATGCHPVAVGRAYAQGQPWPCARPLTVRPGRPLSGVDGAVASSAFGIQVRYSGLKTVSLTAVVLDVRIARTLTLDPSQHTRLGTRRVTSGWRVYSRIVASLTNTSSMTVASTLSGLRPWRDRISIARGCSQRDDPRCVGARTHQGDRASRRAGEMAVGYDGQHDWGFRQAVERARRYDQHRARPLVLMAGSRIERHEIDRCRRFHPSSSPPNGLDSSHSQSSAVVLAEPSHWANSSSSV